MNPRKKQKKPALAQTRKAAKKHFPLRRSIALRLRGAKRNHGRLPPLRPERLRRAVTLDRRSKANRPGIAQHAILPRQPIHLFLEMLQGKSPLEIGVQHAVRKHDIRSASANHAIAAIAMPLPQAMDHHPIESRQILPQPRLQPGRKAIASLRRPQCVYRKPCPWTYDSAGSSRQTSSTEPSPLCASLTNALGRPSRRRRKRRHHMQQPLR